MHLNAAVGKIFQHFHKGAFILAPENRFAHRFIEAMNGNIKRAQPLFLDTLKIPFGKIGQCNVIPVEERQTEIIIFDIQSVALSFDHLIHKAENAVVAAFADAVENRAFKTDAEVVVIVFFNADPTELTIGIFNFQRQIAFRRKVLIIDDIAEHDTVDTP